MVLTAFMPKVGRIAIAVLGILFLLWSFLYFDPFAASTRFAKLPLPPQGDDHKYPKVEDLTAVAEYEHPLKSTKWWFYRAAGHDTTADEESETWFRLFATNLPSFMDPTTRTNSYTSPASGMPISNNDAAVHIKSDAGSLEAYVAPANVSLQQSTPLATGAVNTASASDSKPTGVSNIPSEIITITNPASTPLILYAYSPATWALPNLKFFLMHGLHGSATFIFIINGALIPSDDSNQSSSTFTNCTEADILDVLEILEPYAKKHPNVSIWKRPNTCYDLGAYAEVLKTNSSALVKSHEKFILMNASLRGPFVPFWSRECWSDAYIRLIDMRNPDNATNAGPVKLMILATDQVGINVLLGRSESDIADALESNNTSSTTYTNIGIDACPTSMDAAVNIEVSLTSLIESYNYTVRAMMAEYWSKQAYELDCTNGDINAAKGAYEGGDLGVFETLFIKTRWAVEADQTRRLTQWYDGALGSRMSAGAWDKCGDVK